MVWRLEGVLIRHGEGRSTTAGCADHDYRFAQSRASTSYTYFVKETKESTADMELPIDVCATDQWTVRSVDGATTAAATSGTGISSLPSSVVCHAGTNATCGSVIHLKRALLPSISLGVSV